MEEGSTPPPSEVSVFCADEAYVYRIPPASTAGHRAETWNVNEWLHEVRARVTSQDEVAWVRLEDVHSGNLFAECPIPIDAPLITASLAVEPVVDSSRYFVLKIVDRVSGRHAFVGLGFRQRESASDFNAALHEHLQYVRRKHAAVEHRAQYKEQLAAHGQESEGPVPEAADMRIPEGENLVLKVPVTPFLSSGASKGGFVSANRGRLSKTFSLLMDGEGNVVAGMSPRTPVHEDMSLSPTSSSSSTHREAEGDAGATLMPLPSAIGSSREEWGEFVG